MSCYQCKQNKPTKGFVDIPCEPNVFDADLCKECAQDLGIDWEETLK